MLRPASDTRATGPGDCCSPRCSLSPTDQVVETSLSQTAHEPRRAQARTQNRCGGFARAHPAAWKSNTGTLQIPNCHSRNPRYPRRRSCRPNKNLSFVCSAVSALVLSCSSDEAVARKGNFLRAYFLLGWLWGVQSIVRSN
jgi:hypothetical protein